MLQERAAVFAAVRPKQPALRAACFDGGLGSDPPRTNQEILQQVLKSLSSNSLTAYNEELFWLSRNIFATALFAVVGPAHAVANFSDKSNNTDMSSMLKEAYRYFARLGPARSGNVTALLGADSGDVRDIGTVSYSRYAGNDTTQIGVGTQGLGDTGAYTSAAATQYAGAPADDAGCGRNYILYSGNGLPSGSQQNSANADAGTNFSEYAPLPASAVPGYYGDSLTTS